MNQSTSLAAIQKRQYFNQANIVYISTFLACFIFIPIFVNIGNPLLLILCFTTMAASFISFRLNKVGHYRQASLIFISFITLQTFIEVIYFDMVAGFVYYFFNMTGLIIYTNWSNKQKIIGVSIETVLFIIAFFISFYSDPVVVLSTGLIIFFHISNIILNIVGVGNSALYYVRIAYDAQLSLSKLALVDHLTELPNRTAIAQHFDQMNITEDWTNQRIAVLMIDIDHFKQVNDSYGHTFGDSVLKKIAQTLYGLKRSSDFLARYGGEEFMMIIPVDEVYKCKEIAESYRKSIEQMSCEIHNQSIQLTISIGVYYKNTGTQTTMQEAIEKADVLLYKAKEQGRNQVVMHVE